MIEFEFLAGAQTVTGSKHLLHTTRSTVLLDAACFKAAVLSTAIKTHGIHACIDSPALGDRLKH